MEEHTPLRHKEWRTGLLLSRGPHSLSTDLNEETIPPSDELRACSGLRQVHSQLQETVEFPFAILVFGDYIRVNAPVPSAYSPIVERILP